MLVLAHKQIKLQSSFYIARLVDNVLPLNCPIDASLSRFPVITGNAVLVIEGAEGLVHQGC